MEGIALGRGPNNTPSDVVGLYYMRGRWYDPQAGRFIQEDPLGLAGGVNVYLFAGDDPINGRDPSGELPPCPGRLVCLAVIPFNFIGDWCPPFLPDNSPWHEDPPSDAGQVAGRRADPGEGYKEAANGDPRAGEDAAGQDPKKKSTTDTLTAIEGPTVGQQLMQSFCLAMGGCYDPTRQVGGKAPTLWGAPMPGGTPRLGTPGYIPPESFFTM